MAKQRRSHKMTRKEYFLRCRNEYVAEFGVAEIDPDHFAKWMVDTGRYELRPLSAINRCRQEITRALSDERMIDERGRVVRANHCVRWKTEETLFSRWFSIYDAKPKRMRVSLASRIRLMEAQVHQHFTDWASYNDYNKHGAQLEMFDYNFNNTNLEREQPIEYPDSPPNDGDGAPVA